MSGLGTATTTKHVPGGLFTRPMYTCADPARHTASSSLSAPGQHSRWQENLGIET